MSDFPQFYFIGWAGQTVFDRTAAPDFSSGTFDPWTAVSTVAWITNVTPHSASPPGPADTFDFVVLQNSGNTIRFGNIVRTSTSPAGAVWVHTFIVKQIGLPVYTFTPTAITLNSAAQLSGSILLVDTSQSPANWYFYTNVDWIYFPSGAPRVGGSDSQLFTIPPYHSPAGQAFYVTQNTTGATRVGTITVHDNAYNKDWENGIIPPTTPALATFTVTQTTPDVGPDPNLDPPGGGGSGGATAWGSPFNLPDDRGWYFRCAVGNDGNVYSWRANNNGPFGGFDVGPTLVSATAVRGTARMAFQPEARRLYIVFAHVRLHGPAGTDVYLGYSDSEATTWNGADLMIPGGTHPTICIGLDGTIVIAAYVGPVGGPGVIQSVVMGPGDTVFTAPITLKDGSGANLVAQDDVFHIIMSPSGDRSWFMVFMHGTDTQPSEWTSADADASTWKIP